MRWKWERWSPAAGIVFVALWIVALAITGDSPDTGDSDGKILSYYADGGHRARDFAALFLVLAASLFFLWFLAALRSRLATAEGGVGRLATAAFGAGVASTVLWFAAVTIFASPSAARSDSAKFQLDPNTWRLLNDLGYTLWFGGTTIAAVTVVATALLSWRTGLLPRWLTWLSFVVAVTLLVAFLFIPILIFFGWVLVVSIVLVWRQAPESAAVTVTA
jgi:hypothetical protein